MNEIEVRDGVLAGVRLALKRAQRWSDGRAWPSDSGAENLIQVSVAEKVYASAKSIKPVIELEATLNRLGVDDDLRRVDIALMRHADTYEQPHPFCVIEVKKAPVPFAEDLHKIKTLMKAAPSVRYAFLATYVQHRVSSSGRSRSVDDVLWDIDANVHDSAEREKLICQSVTARPIGRQVLDALDDKHCAAAVIHRFSLEG